MAGLSKILVIYYFRSGTTRKLAQAISGELHCDLEQITEPRSRTGPLGYTRSIIQARQKRPADIQPMQRDLRSYDLVIVGTPVWAWSVSSPVRTFLANNRQRLPEVAFFCTCGASGQQRAFAQMGAIIGKTPRATFGVTQREIEANRFRGQLATFIATLSQGTRPTGGD